MAKIGRNEVCPCGSGKKYKKCCLTTDLQTRTEAVDPGYEHCESTIDTLSNSINELIKSGRLDEAEAKSHDLIKKYPQYVDGIMRLAEIYEAKGDKILAAQYFRKTANFMKNTDGFDPEFITDTMFHAEQLENEARKENNQEG